MAHVTNVHDEIKTCFCCWMNISSVGLDREKRCSSGVWFWRQDSKGSPASHKLEFTWASGFKTKKR